MYLSLFVPGFFVVKMTGGVLKGHTPQKFCRLITIIIFFLLLVNFIFLLPKNNKKVKFTSKMLPFCPIQNGRLDLYYNLLFYIQKINYIIYYAYVTLQIVYNNPSLYIS